MTEPVGREADGSVVRFSARQRVEHFVVMVLFTTLVVTGLPQKFFLAGWAQAIIAGLGGIGRLRLVHRWSGILFAATMGQHLVVVLWLILTKRAQPSLVPTRQDVRDAIGMLRYCLGLVPTHPAFDRYDYRQKFEYWGVIFGSLVMALTGFVLYFPIAATRWLPGEVVPASRVAHSSEALLATLVIVIWHMYSAHFNPDVFPMDSSIFTGRISLERLRHEHGLEYDRLRRGAGGPGDVAPGEPVSGGGGAEGRSPDRRERPEGLGGRPASGAPQAREDPPGPPGAFGSRGP